MITLLLTVFLVVLISAICSMTEAALYSVPWTYIENLRKQGSATGELLYQLRSRIDQPIAAVLTLNTVANTAGAAIAGAVAANVLGADNTALFAAGLTILILTDEQAAQTAETACEKRLDNQLKTYQDYAPVAVPRLEGGVIRRAGNTVLLAVGDPSQLPGVVDQLGN
jgi:hypothetical protein